MIIGGQIRENTQLEGNTDQASHDVVKSDDFAGAVGPPEAEEDFGELLVVMDADIERALACNSDFRLYIGHGLIDKRDSIEVENMPAGNLNR